MFCATIETTVGPLTVTENNGAIVALNWRSGGSDDTPLLRRSLVQIEEYFAGDRTVFDLPLRVEGSQFQRSVCDFMSGIPFGETVTYGDIAQELKAPAQAIGQACGGNPIPVIIPCHRVLGANGLGGFSGGGRHGASIETKVLLLRLEGAAGLLI